MLTNLLIILTLVFDTFIIVSLNGDDWKENLKNYLGIEVRFATVGVVSGSVILTHISADTFKLICGIIIVAIQLVVIARVFELPEKINAVMLGLDSIVIFSTLPWYPNIPLLLVCEIIVILLGSFIGSKILKYVPEVLQEYASNIVMIALGIFMVVQTFI